MGEKLTCKHCGGEGKAYEKFGPRPWDYRLVTCRACSGDASQPESVRDSQASFDPDFIGG